MLSRTAEAFFWIGRYIERAEYIARFTDVQYHLLLDAGEKEHVETWGRYLESTGALTTFRQVHEEISTAEVVEFLTLDQFNPNSIVQLIAAARDNARSIQDQLSSEVWQEINTFYLSLKSCSPHDLWEGPHHLLYRIQHTCYTLYGVFGSTMIHDDGWCFYRLGQNIERGLHTANLLGHPTLIRGAAEPAGLQDFHHCLAVLKSASAYEAYRKSARSDLVPTKIVRFLLFHPRFPRSVRACTDNARQLISRLTTNPSKLNSIDVHRTAGQLAADLEFAALEEVYRDGLAGFLSEVSERLENLSDTLTRTFFHGGGGLDVSVTPQPARRRPMVHHHEPVLTPVRGVLSVEHQFTYTYESPVTTVRTLMRPAPVQHYGRQRRLDIRWHMEPAADYRHYVDAFGNLVWQLEHPKVEETISCLVQIRVETVALYRADGGLALQGVGLQDSDCSVEPAEFTRLTPLVNSGEPLTRLAQHLRDRGTSPVELADAILHQVHAHMRYEPGRTAVHTSAAEAFRMAAGVCQDYAHVMLALCRLAGLPARYVSGYLPGEGQMHAWVEVLLPVGEGNALLWVAYDPTHQRRCDERYVTVAVGRDYQDIAPTSGYYSGEAKNTLDVRVAVVMESQGPAEQWIHAPARFQLAIPASDDTQQQQQ